MNIVCKTVLFFIPLACAAIFLNGDDVGLPDYLQQASTSRGMLSKAVEPPSGLLSSTKKLQELDDAFLDDLPFSVDTETTTWQQGANQKNAEQPQDSMPSGQVSLDHKSLEDQKKDIPVIDQPIIPEKEPVVAVPERAVMEGGVPVVVGEPEEIVFNFENADLSNLVSYVETLFDVQFIADDAIVPPQQGSKLVTGNKISFKTEVPLNRKQAWSLFLIFLDMAGLSVVQQADPRMYRIVSIDKARKSALPSYIGTDSELLPDNDMRIRYVYFVKDTPMKTLENIVRTLKSSAANAFFLNEVKAIVITDSSYNIKSLMRIIRELDKINLPQAMSVLKLRRVDAKHVEELYKSIEKSSHPQGGGRLFGARKSATSLYFPEGTRMIVEPRTNSLILLGTQEDIRRIEDFVIKHIDVEIDMPYSPLHVYDLEYADASTVANVLTQVVKFGQGKKGAVRGEDKYLSEMTFTPEKTGNRLIIRGEYEDFLKVKEVLEKLDAPQPQVAIEVLILAISLNDEKELGAQIRKKWPQENAIDGGLGKQVNWQTSGIRLGGSPSSIVQNTTESGTKRLLGDIVSLVTGATAGNTVLALGNDAYGVWGIFNALKTVSNLQVISNPFLLATNKTKAIVSLGEIKNVTSSIIAGTQNINTFDDKPANLSVAITPQINSDGMIVLDLTVDIVEFVETSAEAIASVTRTNKKIETKTILADQEVLALGGLIKNKIETAENKTPILGNIPILGWLFKNKAKSESKEDLLVLISAKIIDPFEAEEGEKFTTAHIDDYKNTVREMRSIDYPRDVIDRSFFQDKKGDLSRSVDKLIFKRDKKKKVKKKKKRRRQKEPRPVRVLADAKSKRKRGRRRRSKKVPEQPMSLADRLVVTVREESVDSPASQGGGPVA